MLLLLLLTGTKIVKWVKLSYVQRIANQGIPAVLLRYIARLGIELILGIDSNAHHNIWGDKLVDKRREMVLDFIINSDLEN